jgi:hypothetical protein
MSFLLKITPLWNRILKDVYTYGMTKTTVAITSVIILSFIGIIFVFARGPRVSPEVAQKACDVFAKDVKAKITAIPSYQIVKEYPVDCRGITDEASSMDYTMHVTYRIKKTPDSSDATIREDIKEFTAKLPRNDYGISVENASPAFQPLQLCVSANRYLDNTGEYIPQGSTKNKGRFIEQNKFAEGYHSSCD